MSRCDLDLWSFDLEILKHFGCHVLKLRRKCERNRIIYGWVIEDLARIPHVILWAIYRAVLRGAWTQLQQTWRGYRAIITTQEICFKVQISCCIFKRGRLKAECCFKRHQISHFFDPPVKIRGGWARSLYQLLKLYLRPNTEPPKYIAAEHGGLI